MPFFKFTVTDTLSRILQGVEEILRVLGRLPGQPANLPPPVPTITKSIGSSGRDYSTITSWESDLDNGAVYASGDTAVGECYDDSVFDESVTINGGGTVGLAAITLQAATGERHSGIAGVGARIVRSGAVSSIIDCDSTIAAQIGWLEFNCDGRAITHVIRSDGGAGTLNFHHNIIHNMASASAGDKAGFRDAAVSQVVRNIIYNLADTGNTGTGTIFGIQDVSNTRASGYYNNTVHDITNDLGSGGAFGIDGEASTTTKNNIVTQVDGSTSGTKSCFVASGTEDYNASSDATAAGANSLTSITTANQYVSTVLGSEDLHLKSGATAIDEGQDLVATPTHVNLDVDARDVDAQGDTWDIGADEFVAAAGVAVAVFYYHLQMQGIG